jgi:flagella basal body P-ring formation protein FlgA
VPAPVLSPIVITFRESAEVHGPVVRLGEIAAVEGDQTERDLLNRLEQVEVGVSPLPGNSRSVSAPYARVRIKQAGLDSPRLALHGPELIRVSRAHQLLPPGVVEEAVLKRLESGLGGAAALLSLPTQPARLPEGVLELKVAEPRVPLPETGSIPVQVFVAGRLETTVSVSYRLVRRGQVVVPVRDLALGEPIRLEDLRVEERPATAGQVLLGDPAAAAGMQCAQPIKAGTPLYAGMLRPAIVVKRGSRVRLICRGETLTVSAAGEALQDAAAGQPVKVRNLASLLELVGRAVGPDLVEVAF